MSAALRKVGLAAALFSLPATASAAGLPALDAPSRPGVIAIQTQAEQTAVAALRRLGLTENFQYIVYDISAPDPAIQALLQRHSNEAVTNALIARAQAAARARQAQWDGMMGRAYAEILSPEELGMLQADDPRLRPVLGRKGPLLEKRIRQLTAPILQDAAVETITGTVSDLGG